MSDQFPNNYGGPGGSEGEPTPQYPTYGNPPPQNPQQPPYGQSPYGQPAYGASYPAAPYGSTPTKSSKAGLYVVLAIVTAIVLFCGGSIALVAFGVKDVGDSLDDRRNMPGGSENPITVTLGQSFDIGDFEYAEGWVIAKGDYDQQTITGLTAKNVGEDSDNISLDFQLLKGDQLLTEISCNANGSIRPNNSVELECAGFELADVAGYDTITVANAY